MNEVPREPKMRPTTQAAEGVPRMRWTLAEFERLIEVGILTEDDRVELIQGELVPMAPKGNRHELVRDEIMNWMTDRKPVDLRISSEIGWCPPDADTYVEPDILVCPGRFKGVTVSPTRSCSPPKSPIPASDSTPPPKQRSTLRRVCVSIGSSTRRRW